jgi:hypothetical protein
MGKKNALIDKLIKDIRKKTAVSPTVKVNVTTQAKDGNPEERIAYFDPADDSLFVNPKDSMDLPVDVMHELGHAQQFQLGRQTKAGEPIGLFNNVDSTDMYANQHSSNPIHPMNKENLYGTSSPGQVDIAAFQMAKENLRAEQELMADQGESPNVDIDSLMNKLAYQKKEQDFKNKKKSKK